MSGILSAAELKDICDAIDDYLLPDTCTLGTTIWTSDGEAGHSKSRGTVVTDVPCRLDSKVSSIEIKGIEKLAAGQIMPFHTYILTLPGTAVIDESYWVLKGSDYYQVRSVDTNKSWRASRRAFVERK